MPATPDFEATITEQANILFKKLADFSIECDDFSERDISMAPDGSWVAIHCGYSYDENKFLEIASKNGDHWKLDFMDFLPEKSVQDGIPMGSLYPVHWSSDGGYLYFVSYISADGGGMCFYGIGVSGLFRIEVQTGFISTVLPKTADFQGYEFTFSPNGRWLAYYLDSPNLLDLQTGKEITLPGNNVMYANLTWSPDGKELAYVTCNPDMVDYSVERSTVEVFSLESQTSEQIIEMEDYAFHIEAWNNDQMLRIFYLDDSNDEISFYYYWSIKQLITPIPVPKL
ncbi:MAG: hypothetical protein ABFD14_01820 [Anaerolineaceae bacterium]